MCIMCLTLNKCKIVFHAKMAKRGQDDAVLSFAYLVHESVIMSEVNRSGADAQQSSTLHKAYLLVHLKSL